MEARAISMATKSKIWTTPSWRPGKIKLRRETKRQMLSRMELLLSTKHALFIFTLISNLRRTEWASSMSTTKSILITKSSSLSERRTFRHSGLKIQKRCRRCSRSRRSTFLSALFQSTIYTWGLREQKNGKKSFNYQYHFPRANKNKFRK